MKFLPARPTFAALDFHHITLKRLWDRSWVHSCQTCCRAFSQMGAGSKTVCAPVMKLMADALCSAYLAGDSALIRRHK